MNRNAKIDKISIKFTQIITGNNCLYALDTLGHVWRYGDALTAGANTLSGGLPMPQWQRLPAYYASYDSERGE